MGAFLLIALLLVVATTQLLRPKPVRVIVQGGHASVGATAPDFTTESLDGATVRLSQYRGKPVLLNFWATWCAPCQSEMPLIQRASVIYHPQGLVVLAIDYQQTDANSMQAFLRKVDAHFPALFDPAGQIAAEYGVNVGLPVSVFIDRSGKVSFIQLGQMSNVMLQQHLQSIV